MTSSLSNLVNNLSEAMLKVKCMSANDYRKSETCGIMHTYCNCFLEYIKFKDDSIEYKCCNKIYQRKFSEKLRETIF